VNNILVRNANKDEIEPALYLSKKTGRVIAADGVNDHKAILLNEEEAKQLTSSGGITNFLYAEDGTALNNETFVLQIDPRYQNITKGEVYDLTNKSDFQTLAKMTGESGMSYSQETLNSLFNSTSITDDMTKIFFQNGMDNDYKSAAKSAALIEQITGQQVGIIVNSTNPKLSIGGDLLEYLPSGLYLKDVLNGEVYQQIASDTNGRNVVIMHSAGNEDAIKSAKILKLSNANLSGNIDFISVGSPRSLNDLKSALAPVGGNVTKQYNNWKDPVTHSKTWAIGASGLFVAGAYYGATVGIGATTTGNGLEAFGSGLIGGGIGGGAIVGGIKIQHPFEAYFNKDFKGLQTDIKNWAKENSPTR
jgi:hypothetical protein